MHPSRDQGWQAVGQLPPRAQALAEHGEGANGLTGPQPQQTTRQGASTLQLPVLVFGRVEVRRLSRELEALEEFMRQSSLREPGKQPALPRISRLLDAMATDNHLNLLQPADRLQLEAFLHGIEQTAPTIHVSFATDPSSAFTAKLITWLRDNIAPNILLDTGLQPNLAAGCVVRTTNKVFDMSLRQRFADARGSLLESLEANISPAPAAVVPAPEQLAAAQPPATPVPTQPQPAQPGVAQ